MRGGLTCTALVSALLIAGCSAHYQPSAPHYLPEVVGVEAWVEPHSGRDYVYVLDDGRTATVPWDATYLHRQAEPGQLLIYSSSPRPNLFNLPAATSPASGCFLYSAREFYVGDDWVNAYVGEGSPSGDQAIRHT
jgi:hypothetical protein